MSLLRKFLRDKPAPSDKAAPVSATTDFQHSLPDGAGSSTAGVGSRDAPRRELVRVVLRDTMRRHGIPSDWIECRVLSVVSRSAASGVHVTFIVRGGQDRLLSYVPAFQSSFWEVIRQFDPRARDWLFSLSWQFDGMTANRAMPDPTSWTRAFADAGPAGPDEELQQDLQALFAIRDAALREAPQVPAAGPADPPRR